MGVEYIRSGVPGPFPQLLQVRQGDRLANFDVVHAEHEHQRCLRNRSKRQDAAIIAHAHPHYHIVLYTDGQSSFILGNRRHPARQGVLVLTSPGERHLFAPCTEGEIHSIEFTFGLEDSATPDRFYSPPFHTLLADITGIPLGRAISPVKLAAPEYNVAKTLLESLLHSLQTAHSQRERFDTDLTILQLIRFVALHCFAPECSDPDPIDDRLVTAKRYIDTHYSDRLTLDDIARMAAISPRHLIRLFKACFQLTPIAYQQSIRLSAARTLLLSTGYRVGEIAERVGYADLYQFTKAFKKHYGHAPSHMRKAARPRPSAEPVVYKNSSEVRLRHGPPRL